MEPLLAALNARRLLATLRKQGGVAIAAKTLAQLVAKEGLPAHTDPFGSGRRVFLESEIRAWWNQKLQSTVRPIRTVGRPRKVHP